MKLERNNCDVQTYRNKLEKKFLTFAILILSNTNPQIPPFEKCTVAFKMQLGDKNINVNFFVFTSLISKSYVIWLPNPFFLSWQKNISFAMAIFDIVMIADYGNKLPVN